jgi:RecJ-like exonuclease
MIVKHFCKTCHGAGEFERVDWVVTPKWYNKKHGKVVARPQSCILCGGKGYTEWDRQCGSCSYYQIMTGHTHDGVIPIQACTNHSPTEDSIIKQEYDCCKEHQRRD